MFEILFHVMVTINITDMKNYYSVNFLYYMMSISFSEYTLVHTLACLHVVLKFSTGWVLSTLCYLSLYQLKASEVWILFKIK